MRVCVTHDTYSTKSVSQSSQSVALALRLPSLSVFALLHRPLCRPRAALIERRKRPRAVHGEVQTIAPHLRHWRRGAKSEAAHCDYCDCAYD